MTLEEKLKEMPPDSPIGNIKLRIPDDVEQLMSSLKEGYIWSLHNNGTGLFIAEVPGTTKGKVQIYPVYPKQRKDVLQWEVIEVTPSPDDN